MNGSDESTWYELRPNGHLAIAIGNPRRYHDLPAAEEAARQMRERLPDFRFVEIVSYQIVKGEQSRAMFVARI